MLKIDIAQDEAHQLGLSSEGVAQIMNSVVTGSAVTQVCDDIYLMNVIGRAEDSERDSLETLESLQVVAPSGISIPLKAFAKVSYELEQLLMWRRDRKSTITVKASLRDEIRPTDLVARLASEVKCFANGLPANYRTEMGGTAEESGKAEGPIAKVAPLILFLMATFLMIQSQSVQKLFLVVNVASLGLIRVVAALLPTGTPMGFMAILGILALIGIIVCNSVILMTQIDAFEKDGETPWEAVLEATHHRTRPILLMAMAASLGMIPIAREVFWGPTAYAMIGGIVTATSLTLIFLPVLYIAWYRIPEPGR